MKSKNCKCFACGEDLVVANVTVNKYSPVRLLNGRLLTTVRRNDDMKLEMMCPYCGTDYVISGYKKNLNKLVE